MCGSRELKTAANHRAMQNGDDRRPAELDLVERAMPETRMGDALGHVAFLEFKQIESGGEIFADSGEHHGGDTIRQRGEKNVEPVHDLVVERVALVGTIEPQDGDVPLAFHQKRGRKLRYYELVQSVCSGSGRVAVYLGLYHSQYFIDIKSHGLRGALAARERKDAVEPIMRGVRSFEPHDGAKIIKRRIDRLAACQGGEDFPRSVAQTLAVDQDAGAGFRLDGIASLDVGCAVGADDLPVGPARQNAAIESRSAHGSAENADETPSAIGGCAEVDDRCQFGRHGEDWSLAKQVHIRPPRPLPPTTI